MRIKKGFLKGKSLVFPSSDALRPTKDRVREALFNIIQFDCESAVFLDACAGTGSIGMEALSRGARHVDFVDVDTRHVQNNLESVTGAYSVVQMDLVKYLQSQPKQYDIIYLDPPWDAYSVYTDSLKAIFDFDILTAQGKLICEHRKRDTPLCAFPNLSFKEYRYGESVLQVFKNGTTNEK